MALSLLSLPTAKAEDSAAVIATLPDEASSCRYYLDLREQLKAATVAADPLMQEVRACNQQPPTCTTPILEWEALAARGKSVNDRLKRMTHTIAEALQIMQAKYPQKPACMTPGLSILQQTVAISKSWQQ